MNSLAEDKPRVDHTPTPWHWENYEEMRNDKVSIFWAPPGSYAGENMQADAAFIVKAVNSHQELIDTLHRVTDDLSFAVNHAELHGFYDRLAESVKIGWEALEKARV